MKPITSIRRLRPFEEILGLENFAVFKKVLKQRVFLFLAVFTLLSAETLAHAMEEALELFGATKPLTLALAETIPEGPQKADICAFLNSATMTMVRTDAEAGVTKENGFSYPTMTPWCLLAAKYIQSLERRPDLGDWGCGHGFFARHALLSGANPYALDSNLAAVREAKKNIWAVKQYLPKDLKLKNLYKVFHHSVTDPGAEFMARQNDINVAFNVLHYLRPMDVDLFLTKLYENTKDNGIVILSCDTPRDLDGLRQDFYEANKAKGLQYPGYGVYNISSLTFLDSKEKGLVIRGVSPITPEEETSRKFKMGVTYEGLYPSSLEPSYDNGQTITVNKKCLGGHLLAGALEQPYFYHTVHQARNNFHYPELKKVLELAKFTVLNGWYTDHMLDTLYPFDTKDFNILGSKVVVVAQKQIH